jgi:hypothetical protein
MNKILSLLLSCIVAQGSVNAMDLRKAASSGDMSRVQQLIKDGVPTNEPDDAGWTPLHSAALEGHEEVVKILLASGITHQIKNSRGYTPADFASGRFSPETIHLLEQLPVFETTVERGGSCGQMYENAALIAEVFQSEAGFTNAVDKKPIVATFGCGPCVAVGGYDSINHVAFVVHFADANEVEKCGRRVAYNIRSLMQKPLTCETPIAIHIRGGIKGKSERTVEGIRQWIMHTLDLPTTIASEEVLLSDRLDSSESLSIDSRSGTVCDYNPKLNPKGRKFSKLDELRAISSAAFPRITIAYKASAQS